MHGYTQNPVFGQAVNEKGLYAFRIKAFLLKPVASSRRGIGRIWRRAEKPAVLGPALFIMLDTGGGVR